MNQENKEEIKNSVLFENESYNKTVEELKKVISEKDDTIEALAKQIGDKDQIIINQVKDFDKEKSARIKAENQIAEKKDLKIEHKGNYFKTEEEKFEDAFLKDWEKFTDK